MSARVRRSAPEPPADAEGPDADPYDVARSIALRQLTMAPRSRKQLEDKLAQRGCAPEVAAAVLDRLEQLGLVDDAAFAGMVTRSQTATRGLARRAVAHELRRRGVPDELVEESVEAIDPAQERAQAEELVAKRLRSMHGLAPEVQVRRLAAMLARKGYPADVALPVVRAAVAEAPEHQRD